MNTAIRSSALLIAMLAVPTWAAPATTSAALAPVPVTAPFVPDAGSIAVRCGTLIDGLSAAARKAVTVVIREGRIAALLDDAETPPGLPVLDLGAYTCLPGLIDMHTHLVDGHGDLADLSVYYRRSLAEQLKISRVNAAHTVLAGFTAARDVGTYFAFADRALRDEINAGTTLGPRMQVAGYYLTIPAGGGDLVIPGHAETEIPPYIRMGVARGPVQFKERAEAAVTGGADVLKIIASGAVLAFGGVPGAPEMTPEEIAAVVAVAQRNGLKVAAHAHGARSIKEAILAGADTIEHASYIDDEAIALALQHGTALSMDVYNGSYTDTEGRAQGWPEEFLRKNLETTDVQREGFTKAHAAGVAIVYGTDSSVYPHGLNARQFPIMVQRGMTPMQAIQSATSVAARYMGWEDRVGALAPGRFGDLIAVRGDPLADIALLQDVRVVLKGGLVLKPPN